jgi:hypothetical protein
MPISKASPRKLIHRRQIECNGYKRDDDLWDIEAHMTDTKSYSFPNQFRGDVAAGEPLHDMWMRVTIDDDFTIIAAEASIEAAPFFICDETAPHIGQLVGLRIGRGFREKVKELFGGSKGCMHLVELLLGTISTTAYQTLWASRERKSAENPKRKKPTVIDQCLALSADGDIVHQIWPQFAKKGE